MAAVGSEDDFQPDGNGWWRISLKSHYRTDAAGHPIHISGPDKRPNQGRLDNHDPNIFINGRGVCSRHSKKKRAQERSKRGKEVPVLLDFKFHHLPNRNRIVSVITETIRFRFGPNRYQFFSV